MSWFGIQIYDITQLLLFLVKITLKGMEMEGFCG